MSEEQEAKEDTAINSGEGDKPQVYKAIDDANLAAKRLEDANKVKGELLAKEEEIVAQKRLGGESEAGMDESKPKEETAKEYAEKVMKGEIKLE
ncbi:MAG: hypothetical protein DRR06_15225 [Gammaproteobacteria bacterium]|nr:MAG: hypothetical protein DRR06_15225 [Gammaproteobacteria bacterium]